MLKDVVADIGTIQIICVNRDKNNIPKNLKRPYEYVASIKDIEKYYKLLNEPNRISIKMQCYGANKKCISKGVHFKFFGLTDSGVVNKDEWDELCKDIQDKLFNFLGRDAKMYIEPYITDQRPGWVGKFQCRFETYIMYKELYEKE